MHGHMNLKIPNYVLFYVFVAPSVCEVSICLVYTVRR